MKRSLFLGGVLSMAMLAGGGTAHAQSIIRNNDAHPHLEIEPHLVLGFSLFNYYGFAYGFGVGGGIRIGIPLVPAGFLGRVNDSFALSVGGDLLFLPNYYYGVGYASTTAEVIGHVDVQWNFFLTEKWSVFPELGIAPRFYFGCNGCGVLGSFGDWFDFAVGARYHWNGGAQFPTLTMRLGTAGFAIGISF